MRHAVQTAVLSFMVLSVTGCGTVVNGIYQDLAITSNPGGAQVSVDGISSGTTPVVIPVTRKHAHVVKVEHDGYQPIEASVVPQTSIWEWGNVIFAWLPGLAVDAWTGGMYELSYDRVNAVFPAQSDRTVNTSHRTSVK
ncbi:PEGA domain-containing protein [Nitrospirales bacterium NOB]|nr:MAG: PEGA domain protein [Nitrospira sp. OLB3]MCE7967017.1 PEGA domain-containing protein [Nitrospira sp. NTP2]MDL1888479.1 PEGA domain-containing protein [Nitrospirales bacterium NOB]RIK60006.1 MAG: hypothetical protein DCC63_05470 [Nitrospira sp.]